jgi:hypothetical protein
MNLLKTSICVSLLISTFCSCEKVVDIKLHSADEQYVVEGNITDQPGPYTVKISRSKGFSGKNDFKRVSNAVVTITDNGTITDTLAETNPGIYQTKKITGTPGHTYQLFVKVDNKTYTASSVMPQHVNLDSVYTTHMQGFGKNELAVVHVFSDPVEQTNYYHLLMAVNDTMTRDINLMNDEFLNGQVVAFPLLSEKKIVAGDAISLTLQSVDATIYHYYHSLASNTQVATPVNPTTNIIGGALGYFNACSISRFKTIIAK